MAHIIISLKGPGTERVTLTAKSFASAVAQDFLSEEFWLILMTNRFFIPSTCPSHNVTNFIDVD